MTDSRMNILQVLPSLHGGGVERGTVEIAQALIDGGHRAVVASAGRMVRDIERTGADYFRLPLKTQRSNGHLAQCESSVPVDRGSGD